METTHPHGTTPQAETGDGTWKAVVLIILVGLLAYSNSFTKAFVFDDNLWIVANAQLRTAPWDFLFSGGRQFIRATILLNYWYGGLRVESYHALNLAFHIGAGLLLFGIVRRTLSSGTWAESVRGAATPLALTVALVWLVHPLQTQAVTYIIQRCESMMGFFYLLTLYAVIRGADAPRHAVWWGLLSILACHLGMLSKEVMVTAPVVVLLYDWTFLGRDLRVILRTRWWLYLGLASIWLYALPLVTAAFTPVEGNISAGVSTEGVTPWQYLLTQAGVLVYYVWLSFWPAGLSLDYLEWPVSRELSDALWPGLLVVACLAATAVCVWRRHWLGFVGGWFFLILAPTSSFLPIQDVAVEHRMYLPLAAVVTLAVLGGYAVLGRLSCRLGWPAGRRNSLGAVLAVILVAVLTVRTYDRNEDYGSPLALWGDVVAKHPGNARAQTNLANALVFTRPDLAIEHYRTALAVEPNRWSTHVQLAAALWREGKEQEALSHIETATQFTNNYRPYGLRGQIELAARQVPQALADLQQSYKLRVNDSRYDPTYLFLLGVALHEAGRPAEAETYFAEGMRFDPSWPETADAQVWALLARDPKKHPNAQKEALVLAKAANLATGMNRADLLFGLARVYAAQQDYAEAAEVTGRAIAAAEADGDEKRVRILKMWDKFYRKPRI